MGVSEVFNHSSGYFPILLAMYTVGQHTTMQALDWLILGYSKSGFCVLKYDGILGRLNNVS